MKTPKETEDENIDKARRLAGLPPNRKTRECLRCSIKFESRGQRFCVGCASHNATLGEDFSLIYQINHKE